MRHLVTYSLVLLGSVAAAGCRDDDERPARDPAKATDPFITLTEAEHVIERGALDLVRTGGGADVGGVDGEPDHDSTRLVDAAQFASQSGREFDLFVFTSEAAARRASSSIIDLADGESGSRAANVVAVFPDRYRRVDAYGAVAHAMRRLAVACDRGGAGDPQLQRVCFGTASTPAPEGVGVDRDEAQDEEEPVVVGGLHYDPTIARRLNPNIAPDRALVSGRTPPEGKVWFGVFIRVCNRGDQPRTSTARLALVDAFGERTTPVEGLAADNRFAYRQSSVAPGECTPRAGSVAAHNGGALVLFGVSRARLRDLPVALEVGAKRVVLDL
jgi:hypothetical protein